MVTLLPYEYSQLNILLDIKTKEKAQSVKIFKRISFFTDYARTAIFYP